MIEKELIDYEIDISPMQSSSVILIYLERDKIFMEPEYQRDGGIWGLEKKQLLIDSILNKFDVPKFYLHAFPSMREIVGKKFKYAMIDGKQRMNAIWEFIDNRFPLSADLKYLPDRNVSLAGLTYSELGEKHPVIKAKFEAYTLSVMSVRTDEIELIEDMFYRLNEAVPLNAAEKRNSFGGPLPKIIKEVAATKLFTDKLPFSNRRYRHFDVSCKFLYLADRGEIRDVKKKQLDEFVREYKSNGDGAGANAAKNNSMAVVDAMSRIFTDKDPLLKNVGMIVAYFALFRDAIRLGQADVLTRTRFEAFDNLRKRNIVQAEKDIADADYELLKFEELASTINDEYAIRCRCKLLCQYEFKELKELLDIYERVGD